MHSRKRVGIAGTFDVQNYGDLLFPLLAQEELGRRLGSVEVVPFAYHAKSVEQGWPYRVHSVADLPEAIADLDAMLIGGGFLIRFDHDVAPGYAPPSPHIHHPTGYWLTPALLAIDHGIPLIWNAPGMHCNEIPGWAESLMKIAFGCASYVALRDDSSMHSIARFAADATAVPDTAFAVSRLLPPAASPELERLREETGLSKRYIVVQPSASMHRFVSLLRDHPSWLREHQILMLPVSPVMGEFPEIFGEPLPGEIRLPFWPAPRLLAELISRASAVAGHSYHLMITAATSGVPVFTWIDFSIGKFAALAGIETIRPLPLSVDAAGAFLATLRGEAGAAKPLDRFAEVDRHWDRATDAILSDAHRGRAAIGRFLQQLPAQLEQLGRPTRARQESVSMRSVFRHVLRTLGSR